MDYATVAIAGPEVGYSAVGGLVWAPPPTVFPVIRKRAEPRAPQTLAEAFDIAIDSKRRNGRRPSYTRNLRVFGRSLLAFLPNNIAPDDVTSEDVEEWMHAAENVRTKLTRLGKVSALFEHAVRKGWISKNPCISVDRPRFEMTAPRILTITECESLAHAFPARSSLWFALGLWAGLRPDECMRIDRSAIRPAERLVIVDAAASKVRRRRIIPLRDNAAGWIQWALDRAHGTLSPKMLYQDRRDASLVVGFRWTQDVLRHTHASMRLAAGDAAHVVAAELGNSTGILLTHYRELVPRDVAERFWALRP